MKILFLTNVPSPYRVDFFRELGRISELTVLFEKSTSDERDESWKQYQFDHFTGRVMKGVSISVDSAFCIEVLRYIKDRSFDRIIVSNACTLTGMLAIQYMKLHKIPYFIEGDGGIAKNGKGFKESVKRYFFRGAERYYSTGRSHDEYYITYGAKRENLFRYPFTSLRSSDILKAPPSPEQKKELRRQLGIPGEKMAVAVGRFIEGKGFDVLLRACGALDPGIHVCIIGGSPTPEYLRLAEELGLNNVSFLSFMPKEELRRYYMAADVFVLPTRGDVWGLVVNEAMSCALPVVTTDRCVAGLELISDFENGFIVPVDNCEALSGRLNQLCRDDGLLRRIGENNLKKISAYTIEQMALAHLA